MKFSARRRLECFAVVSLLATPLALVSAQRAPGGSVAVDADDIGGVVTSAKGPEAGVWVRGATSFQTCLVRTTRCSCVATV